MQADGEQGTCWAAQLYDACAAEMLLYGRALGLGHAESQDVLHDAFQAMMLLSVPPRQPRFYLVRTFRNRALNHRRTLWRRVVREFESRRWFEHNPGESHTERAAVRGLRRLPGEQREVIVLKLWHGLTFEAIAELLGISPNTAAGRYRYGLQKLRILLKDKEEDHEIAGQLGDDTSWLSATPSLPEA